MKLALTAINLQYWASYGPCQINMLWGWNNNAFPVYIQFHEISGTIPANRVPEGKSILAQANNGFFYNNQPMEFKELSIGFSTSEVNFVSVGAGQGLDLTFEIGGIYVCDGTEGVVGDNTTAVSNRSIWNNAAGPKRLLRLDISDTGAFVGGTPSGNGFALVTPADSLSVGALAPLALPIPGDLGTHTFFFGPSFSFGLATQSGAVAASKGCLVLASGTAINAAGSQCAIRAIAKP